LTGSQCVPGPTRWAAKSSTGGANPRPSEVLTLKPGTQKYAITGGMLRMTSRAARECVTPCGRPSVKRIALFVTTNLAVLVLLTVIARLSGLDATLARLCLDTRGLLLMAATLGFAGSFISLAMSKWAAKLLMGVQVIRDPATPMEAWLISVVRSHAERSTVGMPEVGVFEAPEMNAFATGARRIPWGALNSGLLSGMSREETAAVLGQEMTHVANGDMVTLAMIQGVVNTFVIFLSRALGTLLDSTLGGSRDNERRGPGPFYFLFVLVLQLALGLLANIVVMWFSRRREFRALQAVRSWPAGVI
jgi:heat shock protein HtpX